MITASIIITYIVGYFICFWMLRTDHESEGHVYTKGARLKNTLLSLLSWIMILIQLFSAWYFKINLTGYWDKPVKKIKE